jgi:hypothetical protein
MDIKTLQAIRIQNADKFASANHAYDRCKTSRRRIKCGLERCEHCGLQLRLQREQFTLNHFKKVSGQLYAVTILMTTDSESEAWNELKNVLKAENIEAHCIWENAHRIFPCTSSWRNKHWGHFHCVMVTDGSIHEKLKKHFIKVRQLNIQEIYNLEGWINYMNKSPITQNSAKEPLSEIRTNNIIHTELKSEILETKTFKYFDHSHEFYKKLIENKRKQLNNSS